MNIAPLVLGNQEGERKDEDEPENLCIGRVDLTIARPSHETIPEGSPDRMMLMEKAAHESEGKTRLAALAGVASDLVAKAGNEIPMLYMRDILYFSESSQPSICANYFILFYFYSFKDLLSTYHPIILFLEIFFE